jgi:hypothetical protein
MPRRDWGMYSSSIIPMSRINAAAARALLFKDQS